MNEMTFECKFDNSTVVFRTKEVELDKIIQRFEEFLRGCGFVFNGNLIVEVEDEG